MPERRFSVTPYRALLFFATVMGLTQILLLVDANFSRAKQFQESDYIMTFYVAGHLVAADEESQLYPATDATNFIGASFDRAAHALLDNLPEKTTAIYMYSPLLAWLFAPLSYVGPNLSLLIWHVLSVFALAISCHLLARSVKINFSESLFLCALFGPLFLTLWSGQLGLVFGLLPLCTGYLLLLHERHLLAGIVWSLLLLKPQYLPAVAFVALIFVLLARFQLALGLAIGTAIFVGANLLIFSPTLVKQWLVSHRLSDTLFTHAQYGIPTHLITSLPADILLLLPAAMRVTVKWPVYLAAMLLWLLGLYCCWRVNRTSWREQSKISLTLAVGCLLSSIALPHLLYYDLCVLIPAGYLLATTNDLAPPVVGVQSVARLAWTAISLYLPVFLFLKSHAALALGLESILLLSLIWLLIQIKRAIRTANAL